MADIIISICGLALIMFLPVLAILFIPDASRKSEIRVESDGADGHVSR